MKNISVVNQSRPLKNSLQAGYCHSFLCKLRGLSFRKTLPTDWGLLLVESRDSRIDTAIHMFFMFFDIGVVWVNEAGKVVDKCFAKKWVTMKAPEEPARYTLEIVPERLDEFQIGDQIRFE